MPAKLCSRCIGTHPLKSRAKTHFTRLRADKLRCARRSHCTRAPSFWTRSWRRACTETRTMLNGTNCADRFKLVNQTSERSFSAVSKPTSANKYLIVLFIFNNFRFLQHWHTFAPLHTEYFNTFRRKITS